MTVDLIWGNKIFANASAKNIFNSQPSDLSLKMSRVNNWNRFSLSLSSALEKPLSTFSWAIVSVQVDWSRMLNSYWIIGTEVIFFLNYFTYQQDLSDHILASIC